MCLVVLGLLQFGCVSEYMLSKPADYIPEIGTRPGNVGNGTPLKAGPGHELATFAGGCFWGTEARFREVPGVLATAVGYSGGHTKNPTYKEVCGDKTGHAESVLIEFDPKKVSYDKLLNVFFQIHDPTTENRQGPDFGTQYRSVIFFHSPKQQEAAKAKIAELTAETHQRIVTELVPAVPFWVAEDYHQQYHAKTGTNICPIPNWRGKSGG